MEKLSPLKTINIHLMTSGAKIVDLRLNLIDKLSQVLPLLLTAAGRLSDARGIKRDLQSFFLILLIMLLKIIAIVCKNIVFFQI